MREVEARARFVFNPVAPTPDQLRALVAADEREFMELAAFFQTVNIARHWRGSPEELALRLQSLWPGSRAIAREMILAAEAGKPWSFSETTLRTFLRDRSFPYWLAHAIEALAPEAKEVVIEELWEHYAAALEQVDAAPAGEERHAEALRRMGDAHEVRMHLTRVHLTQGEREWAVQPANYLESVAWAWLIVLWWPPGLGLVKSALMCLGIVAVTTYFVWKTNKATWSGFAGLANRRVRLNMFLLGTYLMVLLVRTVEEFGEATMSVLEGVVCTLLLVALLISTTLEWRKMRRVVRKAAGLRFEAGAVGGGGNGGINH